MAVYGKLEDIIKEDILGKRIKNGLKYLFNLDKDLLSGKSDGFNEKVFLQGSDMYVIHQVYKTKPLKAARFEAHREYIDLQYVWEGEEQIPISSLDGLAAQIGYDKQKDIQFFDYISASTLVMKPGFVVVIYPADAHAPGLTYKKQQLVRKSVVKVRIL